MKILYLLKFDWKSYPKDYYKDITLLPTIKLLERSIKSVRKFCDTPIILMCDKNVLNYPEFKGISNIEFKDIGNNNPYTDKIPIMCSFDDDIFYIEHDTYLIKNIFKLIKGDMCSFSGQPENPEHSMFYISKKCFKDILDTYKPNPQLYFKVAYNLEFVKTQVKLAKKYIVNRIFEVIECSPCFTFETLDNVYAFHDAGSFANRWDFKKEIVTDCKTQTFKYLKNKQINI